MAKLFLSAIMIEFPEVKSLRAGDRIKLEAVLEDFSTNRPRDHTFLGVTAIHYLDEAPHPIFVLGFTRAKITVMEKD